MGISPRKTAGEFVAFVRDQGVVGLAVGFLIGSATIAWGDFVSAGIDFIVIATIVYIGIKLFGIKHSPRT